ncbi:MAG: ABC transporter substrate-binding protein [Betaproteobacteria bacterium]
MGVKQRNLCGLTAAGLFAFMVFLPWAAHAQSVLRLVPQADLKILDTVQTTNNITSNHGYMIYDTLFSLDGKFSPKPQMVESFTRSPDGLLWKFKLRPGLKFHDGQPVTSKDAVASIQRFAKRIPAGVTMMQFAKEIVVTGGDTFEIRLNKPFGLVLETLAGPENPLFITREADALLDPNTAMTTAIGSGPFMFVREEWVPGSKVVYKKNPDYKPRADAPDGFAGAKLAKVDRVEWLVIPDSNTAVQALIKGEVDIIEIPQTDLLPLIRKDPNITVKVIDRVGTQAIYRMNHLIPPFNNAKARQALLYATGDQKDYLASMIGFSEYEKPCWAVFICGTPFETQSGVGDWAKGDKKANVEKAKQLLKEAGYKGEKVVILDPVETHLAHAQAVVTAQKLRDIGMTVDLQAIDWGTQSARRQIKDPPEKNPGAWNIFHTWGGGLAMNSPLSNTPTPSPCDGKNWFGWPCDEELEKIRLEFPVAAPEKQKEIVERLQKRFYEVVPYIPAGQFFAPIAYRKSLSGILETPRLVLWNIEKK